jgi:arylsulfatase
MSIARAVMIAVTLLAGALVAVLPATAQVLQGEPGAPSTREFPDSRVLPTPTPPFAGDIQPNLIDSKPAWPSTVSPPEAEPNVLLILIDDAGFGSNTAFGVVVPTPTLDELAKLGLRYTQMLAVTKFQPGLPL